MTQRAVPVGIAAMAAVLAALLTGLLSTVLASSAQAASYRYWTYWTGTSDSWTFGSAGPAFTLPEDGDVEGWSFRVSTTDGTADAAPTTPPAFDALCGDITAENGLKRVGLVIDPGPASIAPDGETPINPIVTCVVMESDATGYDVLRSVVEVRTDNGLMCGLGVTRRANAPQCWMTLTFSRSPTEHHPMRAMSQQRSPPPGRLRIPPRRLEERHHRPRRCRP